MAKTFQFGDFEGDKARAPHCIACEEMLADVLDGSLGEMDGAWFDRHVLTCAECSEMLADARRGAAWLEMLKTPRPEPSGKLMEQILMQTSGLPGGEMIGVGAQTVYQPRMVPGATAPMAMPANVLEFRPRRAGFSSWSKVMFEPRLAMTAAMAFFSVALTLNLTGVQLNQIHLGDLKPANLKHTYYEANAGAARYYDNLRVVRVMESRVEDLREAAASDSPRRRGEAGHDPKPESRPDAKPASPESKPEEKKKPESSPGVSRHVGPMARPGFLTTEEKVRRNAGRVSGLAGMHGERGLV